MKMMKRTVSILMSLIMVLSLLTVIPMTASAAENEPAPAKESYDIGGITYYNTHSTDFNKNKEQYYIDLFDTKSSALSDDSYGDRSMAQLWLQLGEGFNPIGLSYAPQKDPETFSKVENAILGKGDTSGSDYACYYGVDTRNSATCKHYGSLYSAERAMFSVLYDNLKGYDNAGALSGGIDGMQKTCGHFTSESNMKNKDVIMSMVYTKPTGTYANGSPVHSDAYAVMFTDFEVVPILPANEGSTYMQQTITSYPDGDNGEGTIYASTVENNTAVETKATQTVSDSYSSTATSTVSGSNTYTFSEALKAEGGLEFGIFKAGVEGTFTTTQAIEKGWSDSYTQTGTSEHSSTIEITLPPHSNATLKTSNAITTRETRYNCPVAIRYTAYVVDYNYTITRGQSGSCSFYVRAAFGEDSGNAIKDLEKRYNSCGGSIPYGDNGSDPDFIQWNNFRKITSIGSVDAYNNIITHVPMAPTGAKFTETLKTTKIESNGVLPTHPLSYITPEASDKDPFISNVHYTNDHYNYLKADMKVGDICSTGNITLTGYDDSGLDVKYCTFSARNGKWIVVDADGNPWTDGAPVTLNGSEVNAVRPGTCYLKYLIDDRTYNTSTHVDGFITNADLRSTAAIEVTVGTRQGSVEVTGSYTGYVGAQPERLDKDGALNVYIISDNGKEIAADYTWEAKELPVRGIEIDDNGMVTFTKPGTFHVRAVCPDLNTQSDWIEITSVQLPAMTASAD